jgi:Xaa-Pro aminopeptidase
VIATRVRALRQLMKKRGLAAWIATTGDPHGSEYVADRWQSRRWLTGFDGSAGTAVVTMDAAGLWTDSRYWLAAAKAVRGTPFTLFEAGRAGVPAPDEWLRGRLHRGDVAGLGGATVPLARVRALESELRRAGATLDLDHDLVAELWTDRPAMPSAPAWRHDRWSGESTASKLKRVRSAMAARGAAWLLAADLSEVAWLFNIRGADVHDCPLALAYALVGKDRATLFIDPAKLGALDGVELRPYDAVAAALRAIPADQPVLVDPESVSALLARAAKRTIEAPNPITKLKAVKNRTEVRGFRDALRRDGVALVKFFAWLSRQQDLTEMAASRRLHEFRAQQPRFLHDSFDAIVAYEANAALPHYRPGASDVPLKPRGVLLVDSGGTYLDGTTDTTRVVALGPVPARVKRDCTLVLKGVIALSRLPFPRRTSGGQIDAVARQFLWEQRLDFGHGVGHGVGHCLNVHEGPQGIRTRNCTVPIEPGMVTTIEPGFYVAGRYGLRIENMVLCVEDRDGFLCHETLTLAPISPDLLVPSLLTADEKHWLNDYHRRVRRELSPGLDAAERRYLARQTRAI